MSRKARSERTAGYGWEEQYPIQSYVYGQDNDATYFSPQRPRRISGEDEYVAPAVYDAPPPAPSIPSSRRKERRPHRRAQSAQDGESVPLLQATPAKEDYLANVPPVGILRDPRRSRTMSRDGPLRGLPPVSPVAAVTPTKSPHAQQDSSALHTPPSRDDQAAAHLSMQYKSIRSSGIGATSRHRRSASANDGQTELLLKEGSREEASPGYGATAISSPQQARQPPQRTLSVGDIQQQPVRKPSFRRSETEALPPVSPMTRQGSRLRSKSPQSRPSASLRRSAPPDASGGGHRRADSAASVTFEDLKGGTEISPLPPRPRARTASGDGGSATFDRSSYAVPLKPTHRRVDSASSAASFTSAASIMSMASDMSVVSVITDLSKSKLFRGVTESGDVQLHLPIDNIRLTMDPDLESGTIYKQKDWDEEERFQSYHILVDPNAQDLRGFDLDEDCACQCACDNCIQCRSKQEMLPDPRYVINVDDDLYRRVLSEIADSRAYPCGLYYCGHHDDVHTPSIYIAVGIVMLLFLAMAAMMMIWGPYE